MISGVVVDYRKLGRCLVVRGGGLTHLALSASPHAHAHVAVRGEWVPLFAHELQ